MFCCQLKSVRLRKVTHSMKSTCFVHCKLNNTQDNNSTIGMHDNLVKLCPAV